MKKRVKGFLSFYRANAACFLISSFLIVSCGSQVDTGRNAQPFSEDSFGEDQWLATSGDSAVALQCFTPADNLRTDQQNFCDVVRAENNPSFTELFSYLCDQKMLANLTKPECGWNGERIEEKKTFYKKFKETNNKDASSFFGLLSSYSLNIEGNNKSFLDTFVMAHAQPIKFDETYGLPKNTEIAPLVVVEGDKEVEVTYHLKLQTSIRDLSFFSRLRGFRLDNNVEVLVDSILHEDTELSRQGVFSKPKGIEDRNYVIFSQKVEDDGVSDRNRFKIIVFEFKKVFDGGSHAVARKALIETDLNRMGYIRDYAAK